MNKKISLIIVFLTVLLLFSGCVPAEEKSTVTDGITFTDALGRDVTVSRNPKRVAALLGSFADVWLLSGGTLCAAPEDAWDDFGLESDSAVNIGGAHSPDVEMLLSASPDFVLASASTPSNTQMLSVLEGAGITVAYFDVDCFEDYLSMLKICTDITGRADLYEKNGTDIKGQIDKVKADFSSENLSDREKTVLVLRASSGFVKAKGSEGTVLGEMLSDIGCINIADGDTALLENLSIESIIGCEPYRIFIVTMGDDSDAARRSVAEMMEENPAWGELEAIKENRVFYMDKKLFNLKPNSRWGEAYEKLGEILCG